MRHRRPPKRVTTEAVRLARPEPQVRAPRIVCARCGGRALRRSQWQGWIYYVCAAQRLCIDEETLRPWVTKVRAAPLG